jgi:hypothetical protein
LLSKAFFFVCRKVPAVVGAAEGCDLLIHRFLVNRNPKDPPMETSLETVALFSLKLAYEEEGLSPILRDDMVMGDYQKDIFELLVRRGDVETIQFKMNECLGLAMDALGGVEKPLGRELHKLSADFSEARSLEQLDQPLLALKGYLKDIL